VEDFLAKMAQILERVRTPLSLAGIAILVLYALYRQILNLQIFSELSSDDTLLVVDSILEKVFWLALVVTILGVLSYLIAPLIKRRAERLQSSADLVDLSLDPYLKIDSRDSKNKKDAKSLNSIDVEEGGYRSSAMGAVDFKFVNRGNATALLWSFSIEVVKAQVNVSPVLQFDYLIEHHDERRSAYASKWDTGDLAVYGHNRGWGDAVDCRFALAHDELSSMFSPDRLEYSGRIDAGERGKLWSLKASDLQPEAIMRISAAEQLISDFADAVRRDDPTSLRNLDRDLLLSLLPTTMRWYGERYLESMAEGYAGPRQSWPHSGTFPSSMPKGMRLDAVLRIHGVFSDEKQQRHHLEAYARTGESEPGDLWISSEGFISEANSPSYSLMSSDQAFVVILDPTITGEQRRYPISRKIEPGDVERFHIVLAATKSATITVRFKFHVDRSDVVSSQELELEFERLQQEYLPSEMEDGAQFDIVDGVMILRGERRMRW
jgi:hypothetical protein